MLLVKSVIDQ